ncbi:hypothetical protein CKAN_00178700 [Cinnamomum micranthum f. kanehirae]|uniref:DUF761 domain-containing protein n=1 Tax=Cinnamomum micranthum f. kanehirae TaxID=337451 RepID=A0A3S4N710_9MAGN|nr:hypothetical protein CKAN_00178700 [Cinnamomum micranthum f. kanehirae]
MMEESISPRLGLGKRLWSIARMVYYMVLKGIISKRKLMVDLHLIMKRGKIAGKKAITTLLYHHHHHHHHHPTFICTSKDCHVSSLAPREYEFSCSNSPAYPSSSFPFHFSKRKNYRYDRKSVSALQNSLEMLRTDISEESVVSPGPGFGPSPGPPVRKLRITDSPFPVADADEDCHVDREAEEFIGRFYEQLRLQKRMAALEASFYEEMMINGSD